MAAKNDPKFFIQLARAIKVHIAVVLHHKLLVYPIMKKPNEVQVLPEYNMYPDYCLHSYRRAWQKIGSAAAGRAKQILSLEFQLLNKWKAITVDLELLRERELLWQSACSCQNVPL